MKKFGVENEITTYVNDKSLFIEVPLNVLKTAFEYSPENYDESVICNNKEKEFAELIAEHLHDEVDSEDGANHVHRMLDGIFNEIFEGNIFETNDIIIFGDGYEYDDDEDDE